MITTIIHQSHSFSIQTIAPEIVVLADQLGCKFTEQYIAQRSFDYHSKDASIFLVSLWNQKGPVAFPNFANGSIQIRGSIFVMRLGVFHFRRLLDVLDD